MFFSIGKKKKSNFTTCHKAGDYYICLDDGWTKFSKGQKQIFFKGYVLGQKTKTWNWGFWSRREFFSRHSICAHHSHWCQLAEHPSREKLLHTRMAKLRHRLAKHPRTSRTRVFDATPYVLRVRVPQLWRSEKQNEVPSTSSRSFIVSLLRLSINATRHLLFWK